MSDVNCPYCNAELEINHDDGYGYEEDRLYQQRCPECGKVSAYRMRFRFCYDIAQSPCLNGGRPAARRVGRDASPMNQIGAGSVLQKQLRAAMRAARGKGGAE